MPEEATRYAVPEQWHEWGVRRYGFHGLSVEWAASQVRVPRLVVCHLGGGSSVTAVLDGRSVETTMGFSPLEGVPMTTRSGSVDPGALLYLLREHGLSRRRARPRARARVRSGGALGDLGRRPRARRGRARARRLRPPGRGRGRRLGGGARRHRRDRLHRRHRRALDVVREPRVRAARLSRGRARACEKRGGGPRRRHRRTRLGGRGAGPASPRRARDRRGCEDAPYLSAITGRRRRVATSGSSGRRRAPLGFGRGSRCPSGAC